MPNLAAVEAIASQNPTRTVVLSGLSATVLFSALDAANRLFDWQGAGWDLTLAEVNRIMEILDNARHELMTVQLGEIKMTVAATIPAGCLLCDGATYDTVDYPDLYAVLDPAFILSAEQFSVPDLRGKFPRGSVAFSDVGETGGEATHTLTLDEIATHSHSIPATITTLAVEPGEVAVLSPIPLVPAFSGDSGGGGGHNNLPPYISIQFYIVAR